MECTHCSASIPEGAEFCGGCGRPVGVTVVGRVSRTDESGAVALPRPAAAWRERVFPGGNASTADRRVAWQLRAVVALLVVIFLEVVAGVAQIGPEHSAHRAQNQLASVRHDLAGVRSALGARTKERDDLNARADKLQVDLDDAKKSVAFQSSQAGTFKECLNAIKKFGDAPNTTPQSVLIDLLKQVDKSCTAADRLL